MRRKVLQHSPAKTTHNPVWTCPSTGTPAPRSRQYTPQTRVRSLLPMGPSYRRSSPTAAPSTPAHSFTADIQSNAATQPTWTSGNSASGHITSASLTMSPSSFKTAPALRSCRTDGPSCHQGRSRPCAGAALPSRRRTTRVAPGRARRRTPTPRQRNGHPRQSVGCDPGLTQSAHHRKQRALEGRLQVVRRGHLHSGRGYFGSNGRL